MTVKKLLRRGIAFAVLMSINLTGVQKARAIYQAPANDTGVRVVAVLKAKPGLEGDTKKALLSVAQDSRQEDGCIHYEINQPADDPSVFVFYEVWRSRGDLNAHFEKSYFKAVADRLGTLLIQPADLKILEPIKP
ncbi:MAG: putative quinol monooxygenase [Pseudomonadota bacterium]